MEPAGGVDESAKQVVQPVRTAIDKPVAQPPPARRRGVVQRLVAVKVAGAPPAELGAGPGRDPAAQPIDLEQVFDHSLEQWRVPFGQLRVCPEEGEDSLVLVKDIKVAAALGAQDVALAALAVVHAHPVEHGDSRGREQHRVGPREVLVVAGREGEALVGDEGAPVRLVPHHREQAQQLRALAQVEDLGPVRPRSPAGEQLGLDVAFGLAPPVDPGVVEGQHVWFGADVQAVADGRQRAGDHRVVAVKKEQVVAGSSGDASVPGRAETPVVGEVQRDDPGVPGRVSVDDLAAGVGRAVVDGDDLEVVMGLVQQRVEAFAQVGLDPVGGHDDAESGHRTHPRGLLRRHPVIPSDRDFPTFGGGPPAAGAAGRRPAPAAEPLMVAALAALSSVTSQPGCPRRQPLMSRPPPPCDQRRMRRTSAVDAAGSRPAAEPLDSTATGDYGCLLVISWG